MGWLDKPLANYTTDVTIIIISQISKCQKKTVTGTVSRTERQKVLEQLPVKKPNTARQHALIFPPAYKMQKKYKNNL